MGETRRVVVAGATGAVGRTVLSMEAGSGLELIPLVRPRSATSLNHPRAVALELDSPELARSLQGAAAVMQLIGTMRKRFASGDTYETSDIGTTRSLVAAAKQAGVKHFILLSSVGAGSPTGAYLKAKAEAERLVRESGLGYTLVRPSAFEDREGVRLPGMKAVTRLFGWSRYEPITLAELASALIKVAREGGPLNAVLEGDSLWAQVTRRS